MKKTILFSLAAAALMLAGCAKEAPVNIEVPGTVVKVTASLGDASLTKVTTGSEVGKFAWESGDVIGVWTGSAFTPFTIEESSVGKTAGTFAGTLPEGGTIGFAVYPYCEEDTYADNIYTSRYSGGNYAFKSCVRLYAPAAAETRDYKFQHLCAYVKVTIKNLPAEAKYAFVETTQGNNFITDEASADLSAEYPKFTDGVGDFGFIDVPEHDAILPAWTLYVPISTGEYDNKQFRITFFTEPAEGESIWSAEMDKSIYNHKGFLQTGGVVNRGDLFSLPDIVFEGGVASGISATIEGGLTWLSGTQIGIWDGSSLTVKTVTGGNVSVGEFEGEVPENALYAVSPVTGIGLEGTTLTYTNEKWGFTPGAFLFGTVGEPTSSAYLKSIAFKNMGATIRVTLKNIPAAAKYVFLECGARPFFFFAATVDPLSENPVIEATDNDEWCFVALPEHTGDIAQLTFDMPILTGAYDTPPWGFKAECYSDMDWDAKVSNKPQSDEIVTNGTINRGDIFNVTLTFE